MGNIINMQLEDFMAVKDDGEGVLGKLLYYSLSSILVDKCTLGRLCAELDFPYSGGKRTAMADAYRSATGDIYDYKTATGPFGAQVYKVYCRDNISTRDVISRELIKETLGASTNQYKKLANITFTPGAGLSYDGLAFDEHVDPLEHCREAERLFELYQTCAGRKQIETLLENFVHSLEAVKVLSRGKMYFIPREHMHRLDVFEALIEALEAHNQSVCKNRLPMDANSMYVVDDEKQRQKMALAFYRTAQRELTECTERATHLIQSGSQSAAILERWVLRIEALAAKKGKYEQVLRQELSDMDDEFTALGYLSQELQIRARGIRINRAA